MPVFKRTWVLVLSLVVLSSGCHLVGLNRSKAPTKRIAVLPIKRAQSPQFMETVAGVVESRYELIPAETYRSAAKRLKAKRLNKRNVRKVADELDLAATVDGRVVRRGKRFTLRLFVREGASGKLLKRIDVPVKRRKMGQYSEQLLNERLVATIDGIEIEAEESAPTGRWGKKRAAAESDRSDSDMEFAAMDASSDDRDADKKRKADDKRKAELAKKAEEKRKADDKRKAELAKKADKKRKADDKRKAELAKKAEEKRKADDKRKAELAKKKSAKKKSDKESKKKDKLEKLDELPATEVVYDERGQAIDDEVPPGF